MRRTLKLREAVHAQRVFEWLIAHGLGAKAAAYKAELFAKCCRHHIESGIDENTAVLLLFVPGRIEVLGKHTDYAGGRSLLATVEKGFCAAAIKQPGKTLNLTDIRRGERVCFGIDRAIVPSLRHWSNYPMTVAKRVAMNFADPLYGAKVAFASDLPPAAGMSSSSAMIVIFFLVIAMLNDLFMREEYKANITDTESLAAYLGTVENGQGFGSLVGDKGVGTCGGSEDHTAILCCRPKSLSQYAFCPVRMERHVRMPEGFMFAIANSGVSAQKTGATREKYNRVANLAATIEQVWNRYTGRQDPHLAAILDHVGTIPLNDRLLESIKSSAALTPYDYQSLLERLQQFIEESTHIIPAAGDALLRGDMQNFAELVDRSQRYAEDLLKNQIPETIFLARRARELGAAASSAFGGGFGGAVWALVRNDMLSDFLAQWSSGYASAFPERISKAEFFPTDPGPAAFWLEHDF